jgi:hypothetical protein
MADLPDDLALEVRRTLTDLRAAKLASTAWPAVAGDLGKLASAVDHGDDAAVRCSLLPVSQAAFEGKVRGRLAAAGGSAAVVVATKQTSALPLVGAGSAALLVLVGYALGGWLVAGGTALLGLFIFGVALAGSRTNRDRIARRASLAPSAEHTEPAPRMVAEAINHIEVLLGQGRAEGD